MNFSIKFFFKGPRISGLLVFPLPFFSQPRENFSFIAMMISLGFGNALCFITPVSSPLLSAIKSGCGLSPLTYTSRPKKPHLALLRGTPQLPQSPRRGLLERSLVIRAPLHQFAPPEKKNSPHRHDHRSPPAKRKSYNGALKQGSRTDDVHSNAAKASLPTISFPSSGWSRSLSLNRCTSSRTTLVLETDFSSDQVPDFREFMFFPVRNAQPTMIPTLSLVLF